MSPSGTVARPPRPSLSNLFLAVASCAHSPSVLENFITGGASLSVPSAPVTLW